MPVRTLIAVLALISLPAFAATGDGRLQLPNFDSLEHKAAKTVNVTLGPSMINLASLFTEAGDANSADAKKVLAGIESIQIRHFEFDTDNAYSAADIESIRGQLHAPEWHRIVQTRDLKTQHDVDVYSRVVGNRPAGLAVLVTEPRQFTVVDIVGEVDAATLGALGVLGGHVDMPKVDSKPAN